MNQTPQFLTLPDRELAYQQRKAKTEQEDCPGIVFLGGFASDMNGTKATYIDQQCKKAGYAFLRFDYRGHGDSSDKFEKGCIGDWFDDALQAIDKLTKGPQLVIGSSMGGWIGLLLARARPDRLAGFIGVSPAPDFTEDLIRPSMTPAQSKVLLEKGYFYEREEQDIQDGYNQLPITQKLMEDGTKQLVLRDPLKMDMPVRLLQGQKDSEVPWQTALRTAEHIEGDDVIVTLVKDGEHSFSRPDDLQRTWDEVVKIVEG